MDKHFAVVKLITPSTESIFTRNIMISITMA